jgi:hypothetical protein
VRDRDWRARGRSSLRADLDNSRYYLLAPYGAARRRQAEHESPFTEKKLVEERKGQNDLPGLSQALDSM